MAPPPHACRIRTSYPSGCQAPPPHARLPTVARGTRVPHKSCPVAFVGQPSRLPCGLAVPISASICVICGFSGADASIANGAAVGYARCMAERIAIVEDEQNIRDNVAFAFEREGYRVATYADGMAAWEAFQNELPELLILDIIMPRMDGLELCRKVRGLSETVPIIFLTSRDEEFDRVLGLELGADVSVQAIFDARVAGTRQSPLSAGRTRTRTSWSGRRAHASRCTRTRPAPVHGPLE